MARSFPNTKALSALILDGFSNSLTSVDSASEEKTPTAPVPQSPQPPSAIPLLPIMAAPVQMVMPQPQLQDPSVAVGFGPFNFNAELLGVMQEMIRKEVRSYMQQNGMCYHHVSNDGFRNASVKRIGISRIDS